MLQPYILMIVFLSPNGASNVLPQREFPTLQSCEQVKRADVNELKKGHSVITTQKCIKVPK